MKISKDTLKIISKASLGVSQAISPKSIGVDLSGFGGKESGSSEDKAEDKAKDKAEDKADTAIDDQNQLDHPLHQTVIDEANKYTDKENLAPYPVS